jgi:TRAP-type mannitol/chloroaromatic compound transport system permease small subunit
VAYIPERVSAGGTEAKETGTSWSETVLTVTGVIDRFTTRVGQVVCLLVIPLMGTVLAEIAFRLLVGKSLIWTYDMTYMLYGTFFMLGTAYTLAVGGHIRSDFLYLSFPVRVRGLIDSVAYVFFFFPVISALAWYGAENAYEAWSLGERTISSVWAPILWPFRAVVPVAAALLLIQAVSELIKSLYMLIKGRTL